MVEEYADKWWLIALRGILAIVFLLILIAYLSETLVVITWIMGLWALIEGVILIVMGFIKHKDIEGWGLVVLQGVLAGILGLLMNEPELLTLAELFFIIGVWFLVIGIVMLVQAIQVRKEIDGGEWLLVAGSILSMLFGVFLMSNIQVSVAVAGFILGLMLMVTGVMTTAFGFQAKRDANKVKKQMKA